MRALVALVLAVCALALLGLTASPPAVTVAGLTKVKPERVGDGSLIRAIVHARQLTNDCRARAGLATFRVAYAAERSHSLAFRKWVRRLWVKRYRACVSFVSSYASARTRAIRAAEEIRAQGGNPWPNCPDPNDGHSWDDTKACESPGYGWHEDPPGYFCGPLQFDPRYWMKQIRKYGIPC